MPKEEMVLVPKQIVQFTDDGIPYVPPFGDNRRFWCVFRKNDDDPFSISKCYLPEEDDFGCGYDWIIVDANECDIEIMEVYANREKAEKRCEKLNK